MLTVRVDVFAWIPQEDLLNPLHLLPGGVSRWGAGACGPRFGGDGFASPPATYAGWKTLTYRAKQTFAFRFRNFGSRPDLHLDTGVVAGLTTVLSSSRASGGRLCSSMTPTVTKSQAGVSWIEGEHWYEIGMHGAAHDPFPEDALKQLSTALGAGVGSAMTPDLEWNLTIRVQQTRNIDSALARLRYSVSDLMNLDVSKTLAAPINFGDMSNLIHGLAYVRRFPSYVVYVTISDEGRAAVTIPVYFADASGRGLGGILIAQSDTIRQITW